MTTAKALPASNTPSAPVSTQTPAKPAPQKTTPVKAPAKKVVADKKAPARKVSAKKPIAKKPLSKTFASAKPVQATKAVKAEKIKKPKLVRDSFTIPKSEYLILEDLKQRATKLTRPTKKSELLRAGIKALADLSDAAFLTALEKVPAIKTGRPSLEK